MSCSQFIISIQTQRKLKLVLLPRFVDNTPVHVISNLDIRIYFQTLPIHKWIRIVKELKGDGLMIFVSCHLKCQVPSELVTCQLHPSCQHECGTKNTNVKHSKWHKRQVQPDIQLHKINAWPAMRLIERVWISRRVVLANHDVN